MAERVPLKKGTVTEDSEMNQTTAITILQEKDRPNNMHLFTVSRSSAGQKYISRIHVICLKRGLTAAKAITSMETKYVIMFI